MPSALFVYENADKQRLTLQWRKQESGASETAFRYAIEDGVSIFYWIDHDCAYDTTQAVADLGAMGVRCPRFADYVGTLVAFYRKERDRVRRTAMV